MRSYRDIREYRSKLLQRRQQRKNQQRQSLPVPKPRTVRAKRAEPVITGPSFALSSQPKVSILTATYNCSKYINSAVQSVLDQSYTNWEMLICDDMSTDDTFSLIEQCAQRDSRIKVFRNEEKKFCSSTYSRLVGEASGEICGILDGDDMLMQTAVELIVQAYEKNPGLGYIYTQFWSCDSRMSHKKRGHSNKPRSGSLLEIEAKGLHYFSHWRTFRTELRNKTTLFQPGLKSSVDKYLGYVLEETATGGFMNLPLYLYRKHDQSLSSGKKDRRWTVIEDAKNRRKDKRAVYPILTVKM